MWVILLILYCFLSVILLLVFFWYLSSLSLFTAFFLVSCFHPLISLPPHLFLFSHTHTSSLAPSLALFMPLHFLSQCSKVYIYTLYHPISPYISLFFLLTKDLCISIVPPSLSHTLDILSHPSTSLIFFPYTHPFSLNILPLLPRRSHTLCFPISGFLSILNPRSLSSRFFLSLFFFSLPTTFLTLFLASSPPSLLSYTFFLQYDYLPSHGSCLTISLTFSPFLTPDFLSARAISWLSLSISIPSSLASFLIFYCRSLSSTSLGISICDVCSLFYLFSPLFLPLFLN